MGEKRGMWRRVAAAGIVVGWVTAVAAPATADGRFSDDDGLVHESYIEAISDARITQGCGEVVFCPHSYVTRGQMARFLEKTFHLTASPVDAFDDDDVNLHEPAINTIAAAGITEGIGPRRFEPDALVSREQVATFIVRALGLTPDDASSFADVDPTSPHVGSIGALVAADISTGCGPERFCPQGLVTRGQMATLMARAAGLEPLTPTGDTITYIDLRTGVYSLYCPDFGNEQRSVHLDNGHAPEDSRALVDRVWWQYGDVTGDGVRDGVLNVVCVPSDGGNLAFFNTIVTDVVGDRHIAGQTIPGYLISADGHLVTGVPVYSEGDGHCCPSEEDRTTWSYVEGSWQPVSTERVAIP